MSVDIQYFDPRRGSSVKIHMYGCFKSLSDPLKHDGSQARVLSFTINTEIWNTGTLLYFSNHLILHEWSSCTPENLNRDRNLGTDSKKRPIWKWYTDCRKSEMDTNNYTLIIMVKMSRFDMSLQFCLA